MNNKILCLELETHLYFYTTVEEIGRAINKLNGEITRLSSTVITLNDFLLEIGCEKTVMGEVLGWILPDYLLNVQIIPSGLKDANEEVHIIKFIPLPTFL